MVEFEAKNSGVSLENTSNFWLDCSSLCATYPKRFVLFALLLLTLLGARNGLATDELDACTRRLVDLAQNPPLNFVNAVEKSSLLTPGGYVAIPTSQVIPVEWNEIIRNAFRLVPSESGLVQVYAGSGYSESDKRDPSEKSILKFSFAHRDFVSSVLKHAGVKVDWEGSNFMQMNQSLVPLLHRHARSQPMLSYNQKTPDAALPPHDATVDLVSVTFAIGPGSVVRDLNAENNGENIQVNERDTLLFNSWTYHGSPPKGYPRLMLFHGGPYLTPAETK